MKLYVFNPEHDIALANNLAHFTPPVAARHLRNDLEFLPRYYAAKDDYILLYHDRSPLQDLSQLPVSEVVPWGWDRAIKYELMRLGISAAIMPSDEQIDRIRDLSHRRSGISILNSINRSGLCGEAQCLTDVHAVCDYINVHKHAVLKAPWSSSGRGVRFADRVDDKLIGWISNIIKSQKGVMAEPYYNKVRDMAMEFFCDEQGKVTYCGMSLFTTVNGAYSGNILADEDTKIAMISSYISTDLIEDIKDYLITALAALCKGRYKGAIGVDQMIVQHHDKYLYHPCVEINFRYTMGHVALALSAPYHGDKTGAMTIEITNKQYKLKLI